MSDKRLILQGDISTGLTVDELSNLVSVDPIWLQERLDEIPYIDYATYDSTAHTITLTRQVGADIVLDLNQAVGELPKFEPISMATNAANELRPIFSNPSYPGNPSYIMQDNTGRLVVVTGAEIPN